MMKHYLDAKVFNNLFHVCAMHVPLLEKPEYSIKVSR